MKTISIKLILLAFIFTALSCGQKSHDHDNYYLNNIRYGLRAQIGFRGTDLFFNYDLNDLFNSDPYLTQPVVLRGSDGHTAWVNQVMLKRAGVNTDFIKSLADDKRKFFGFSENFKPNGLISEEGLEKIRNVLPANHTDLQEAATLGIKHLNSLGITAWLDPSAGDISEGESNGELAIYKTMSQQNKVTAHVVAVVVDAGVGVVVDIVWDHLRNKRMY